MLNKKSLYTVLATDLTHDGDGVAHIDELVVFVPGLLPGEKASVRLTKIKKTFAHADLVELIKPSPFRVDPPCPYFHECGGCSLQHLTYSAQLDVKRNTLNQALRRIGHFEGVNALPMVGMDNPYRYRSKVQFQVQDYHLGFFAKKSKRLVKIKDCLLIPGDMTVLKGQIEQVLHDHELLVERVVIKKSVTEKHRMVIFYGEVPGSSHLKRIKIMAEELKNVSSLIWMDTKEHKYYHLAGEDSIEEEILGYRFRISPLAFMQVNHAQMQAMYAYVLNKTSLTKEDQALDLYCGMGSLTCHIAKIAKHVIGVEMVHSAIRDAELNARINKLENVDFILGTVEEVLPKGLPEDFHADIIFLDPPRAGVDSASLQSVLQVLPREIVYISCNPSTLARDLAILCHAGQYALQDVQPFDMFPQTMHTETVVFLERK